MKIPREIWWIMGLSVLLIGGAYLLRGGSEMSDRQASFAHTTYSNEPSGLRGLYVALQELGYDVRRLRGPIARRTLPEEGTLIITLSEYEFTSVPVTGNEREALWQWLQAGRQVLLATDRPFLLEGALEIAAGDFAGERHITFAAACQPGGYADAVETLVVRSAYRLQVPRGFTPPPPKEPEEVDWYFEDYQQETNFQEAAAGAVPLFRDSSGTVVAGAAVGEGRLVLLASPWSLTNEGIALRDNFLFLLQLLGPPGEAPVYFDEYHHGYGEQMLWRVMPLWLKVALGNLLVALLVVMYGRSRRFGAPVPYEKAGRERSEFLGAMTRLLRKGGATQLTLKVILRETLGRLRIDLGLPHDAETGEIVRAVGRLDQKAAQRLQEALAPYQATLAAAGRPTEAQAILLVRRLDEALQAVRNT